MLVKLPTEIFKSRDLILQLGRDGRVGNGDLKVLCRVEVTENRRDLLG